MSTNSFRMIFITVGIAAVYLLAILTNFQVEKIMVFVAFIGILDTLAKDIIYRLVLRQYPGVVEQITDYMDKENRK
jgi:NADH:ubiquinone oxidoreductase subunit 3 (subunit A)